MLIYTTLLPDVALNEVPTHVRHTQNQCVHHVVAERKIKQTIVVYVRSFRLNCLYKHNVLH